ncbi:hypothetical protein BH20ACT16_BH20ACT16_03820 [soil metagenome]
MHGHQHARKTGTITVVKDLIPASDTGRFDLRIDGNVVKTDAADGDGSGAVTVNTGTHTVSEVAGSVGDVDDYASSISCTPGGASTSGRGPLDVTVGDGADITCTVTNTKRAIITVRKVTSPNDPAATQFAFASDLPATAGPPAIAANGSFSLADGGSVTTTVLPGTYAVSENDPKALGYKLTGLTCTESAAQNSSVASGATLSTARNASIHADPGETIDCTFTNLKVVGKAVVVKVGDTFAYHGDTMTFEFTVSNTGGSPLTNVVVSDDHCPTVTLKTKLDGSGNPDATPAVLDLTDTWTYVCSMPVPAHVAGEENPIVNIATVTATDELERPVSDTDQHSTRILHPAIAIDKTGPATAQAGQRVGYTLVVSNPGDVPFLAPNVNVADALCEAPPLLTTKNGDATPGRLDPGDTWTYTCTVQTLVGQTVVNNVGIVTATDSYGGRDVTDDDPATTQLTQPPVVTPPPVPLTPSGVPQPPVKPVAIVIPAATARLTGPKRCVSGPFDVNVTGRGIAKVLFLLDGRRLKTVRGSAGRTVFKVRVDPRGQSSFAHRITAKVTFKTATRKPARTLRLIYLDCPRQIAAPQFTG